MEEPRIEAADVFLEKKFRGRERLLNMDVRTTLFSGDPQESSEEEQAPVEDQPQSVAEFLAALSDSE